MKKKYLLLLMMLVVAASAVAQSTVPKPANPKIDYWEEAWGTEYQQLMFTIQTDFNGDPVDANYTVMHEINGETDAYTVLDPAKVSFSIYLDDDELFVFTPEEFPYDFTEPTTELPFGFSGMCCDGTTIYFENRPAIKATENPFFTYRIGMQVHYTVDGVKNSSDIVYIEVFPKMKPAADVTSTSFLADWLSPANNQQHAGFHGYDLYVINKNNPAEAVVVRNIPSLTQPGEFGEEKIPGGTYLVENLTPGATYQYYVESKHQWGRDTVIIQSNVQEVTLPQDGHGYELGDVNHDGDVNITDVTLLIAAVLNSDLTHVCPICADFSGDGDVNISDVTQLIAHVMN